MSTPTRPPSAPNWQRVTPQTRPQERVSREPEVPQRRAETAVADAARTTVSALQVALGKAKSTVVPPLSQRQKERDAERARAARRRFAIVWGRRAGYVLVVAAAVWLVLLSPVFALDPAKVEVSGYGTVVDPTAVRDVIDQQEGASLATLSVGHVASLLKDIPGVREAHVSRHWPNGLVVELESREPVAAVPQATGGVALVDDEGVQVGRADKAPKGLPTLTVPEGEKRVLAAALSVVQSLPDELKERVQAVTASTEDSVSFVLAKGPTVEWGSAEDSDLKAQVLQVLLESKKARKADVIDVSAPTMPITKNN